MEDDLSSIGITFGEDQTGTGQPGEYVVTFDKAYGEGIAYYRTLDEARAEAQRVMRQHEGEHSEDVTVTVSQVVLWSIVRAS
jgi:hypothetical protein